MKRDMDLVREILLKIEADPDADGLSPIAVRIASVPDNTVAYHVMLMAEGGLVDAVNATSDGELDWRPRRLTWPGHEFLDAVRNDTVWHRTKQWVIEKGGSVPIELVKAAAIKLAASTFGLS